MSGSEDRDQQGVAFTLKLGRALQTYGAPAYRLEEGMREVVDTLGIEGEFFSTPTVILASLGSGEGRRAHLLRIEKTEVDLSRMAALSILANRVIEGELSPDEGSNGIDEILLAPPPYPSWLTLISFAVTSVAASRFFGAGIPEMILVTIAGLIVGTLSLASGRLHWLGRIFEPVAGMTVSLVATTGSLLVGPVSVPIVTVAGLIVLVPGFTLTVAVNELAQRSLISGTARLHGAMIVFLMLGFGVAVGGNIGASLAGGISKVSPLPGSPMTEWIAVFFAALSLGVLFKAPVRDLGWIVASCGVTFLAVGEASERFGPELGVFIGALVAGIGSNVYARLLNRPAAITRVPAMMLLVPGGLGFLSISSLLEQDVLRGLQTAFSVAIMAVALVTGLLISNAVVAPAKRL